MTRIPRFLTSLIATFLAIAPIHAGESLDALFANPPAGAHPHTWWHWCNGNVNKEGITLDLEAIQRIGVTGVQIFNVETFSVPAGPVLMGSPEWLALTKFAIQEADRLGLELAMQNCAGWSESGGPWITPEQSMQKVVWSETQIRGGAPFSGTVEQPNTIEKYYRDLAVVAYPSLADDAMLSAAVKTYAVGGTTGKLSPVLFNKSTPVTLAFPKLKGTRIVQVEFPAPVKVAAVLVRGEASRDKPDLGGALEVSDDGKTFRSLAKRPFASRYVHVLFQIPETTARFFRLTLNSNSKQAFNFSVSSLEFSGPRIPEADAKAGFRPSAYNHDLMNQVVDTPFPQDACIARGTIIDLTGKLGADGRLNWDVPPGNWTILRMGHTSTGKKNGPSSASGAGLECDKMSRAAVEAHFAGMMGKIITAAGPLTGKSLKMVLADSWEAGCQNWTPLMREEFTRRRGYDPLPWLICLTGRPLGNLEESERFLWDFRRTIADLIAEKHYGTFQELCHQNKMLFTAEAPGINMPTVADQLQCKARTDIPMGEFWIERGGHNDSREPACAAHIGGQQIAAAEAFTARPGDAKWAKTPYDHKALGDLNFSRGINRFVFHRYAMQPWKDRFPGMSMGWFGTNFERTNTWWEQSVPWMQYISRSQALLQAGIFQADILYFYGEGAPATLSGHEPKIPDGYGYDAIDAEALIKNLTVTDGKLTLPSGMSYRVLLMPPTDRLTPTLLKKIKDLVTAGATVIGERPTKSPSLAGYPNCDAEVASIASDLWGDSAQASGSQTFGKGRVIWGKPLAEMLADAGLKPDFASGQPDAKCAWIHRRAGDSDIYFVSNQAKTSQLVPCTFRISGKIPELWHADSGKIEDAPAFTEKDGLTTVPIAFDPAGSVFVIFRKPAGQVDAVADATFNGSAPAVKDLALPAMELARSADGALLAGVTDPGNVEAKTQSGKVLKAQVDKIPATQKIEGPWVLKFPPKWGAPDQVTLDKLISWTDHSEEGVKHFSGTATYQKDFEWKKGTAETKYFLDLGSVKELAQVFLNGKDLGVLWKLPFRVDITKALKPGKNNLEIRITNLWPNRLIGDAALPKEKRLTWSTFEPYKPGDPLLPSGLLGPVNIQAQEWVPLR